MTLSTMGLFVTLSINDTQYAQRYALCRYAECRGAVQTVCPSLIFVRNVKSYTSDTPP
jgi:hypothetical protein